MLVLLAAYNGARWITEQLESILCQSGVNVHVVIRDDGSTDETPRLLAAIANDPRVTIASAGAPSGSAAQNFFCLIRESSAEQFDYVAFSDQDDVWHPQKLRTATVALAAGDWAGYSCATTAVWPDGRTMQLRQSPHPTRADFLFEGAGQGCTFLLKAELYRRFRAFIREDPALTGHLHYHDWSVYAVARAWGLRWFFDPRSFLNYRQHAGNDTGARGNWPGLRRRLLLIRSGWYGTQLRAMAVLCRRAAPGNSMIGEWHGLLTRPAGSLRRLQMARFCLRGGRRRTRDNVILVLSALRGWI